MAPGGITGQAPPEGISQVGIHQLHCFFLQSLLLAPKNSKQQQNPISKPPTVTKFLFLLGVLTITQPCKLAGPRLAVPRHGMPELPANP